MDTESYCLTLDQLNRAQAIRAIQQARLQLLATIHAAEAESFDNFPAIEALTECLQQAGHIGHIPQDKLKLSIRIEE